MRHQRKTICLLAALAGCMLGMTQPQPRGGEPRPPGSSNDEPNSEPPRGRLELEVKLDPDALRIRLQRMIERGQSMAQRAESALEQLNAGANASEVLGELREPERELGPGPERENRRPPRERENGPSGMRGTDQTDQQEMLGFLRDEFPELWGNLEPIIRADPRSAERLLGRMAPQVREILALRRSHPELASIKTTQMRAGLDFVEAARVYRTVLNNQDAGIDEIEQAKSEMRRHAETRFDAELRAKQLEILKLEERLDQLRHSVSALEERREYEVDRIVTAAENNANRLTRQQSQRKQRGDDSKELGDD
jgi:hypothetical protein